MRRHAPLLAGAIVLASGVALQAAGGCAPRLVRSPIAAPASPGRTMTPTPIAARPTTSQPVHGRRPLAAPPPDALPVELMPISGGKAVLAVSQIGGERLAWAR